jgi:hypothetical protein
VEVEEGFLTYVTRRARMRREEKSRVTAVPFECSPRRRNDGDGERIGLAVGLHRTSKREPSFISKAAANLAEEHSQEWLSYESEIQD